VGNALYGMQNMNSESAEVRAMVITMVPKIEGKNVCKPVYVS
jgi:hypothetical protein